GRRAGDVRVHAGGGRDAGRAPARRGHVPRARVDDVVQGPAAAAPAAPKRTGGGEAACGDGDGHGGLPVRVIVGHADVPAFARRLPAHPDVTAEADEHAATCAVGRTGRDAVRGERLGRCPEVQPDAARRTQRAVLGVPLPPSPTGRRTGGCDGAIVITTPGEVAVVAQRANG